MIRMDISRMTKPKPTDKIKDWIDANTHDFASHQINKDVTFGHLKECYDKKVSPINIISDGGYGIDTALREQVFGAFEWLYGIDDLELTELYFSSVKPIMVNLPDFKQIKRGKEA